MPRPNFSAVTGVTAALAIVAAARVTFQDRIPPPNPQMADWGEGEFVTRAQTQSVEWRPLSPRAFAESQRLSRPMLIVVGVPYSALGRQADATFGSTDVARAINRGFIPVRIDAAQDPRWISQFLPLQRARSGFSVGFQAWVLDLRGNLIDFIGRIDAHDILDQNAIVGALVEAQRRFADAALSDGVPALEIDQRADAERLTVSEMTDLSIPDAARTLSQDIEPDWGGWNVRGLILARPLALRFLQLSGETQKTEAALMHTVLSPRADWLDGGFYRVVRRDDGATEYDKVSVTNAQFAETLAVQDALRPNPVLKDAARRTVDWLLSRRDSDGFVPAAEAGDEDERGRSRRGSFPPLRLRRAVADGKISADLRDWAGTALGLDRGARTIVPTAAALHDPRLAPSLNVLRGIAGPPRRRVGTGLADVNGAVAASILRIARLWKDSRLAEAGGILVDNLEAFRSEDDLRHTLTGEEAYLPYLGDDLAYADAALEDFLTNGRVPSLERGATVLRHTLKTFIAPGGGLPLSSPPQNPILSRRPALPQVTDDEREATSAMALRLTTAYAAALGKAGEDLSEVSAELDSRLEGATEAYPAQGGALGAIARRLDARTLFVVGPDALPRAQGLAARLPNRLIVPVLGSARPDLRRRPPGLYIDTPVGPSGPLSEKVVLARLSKELQIGL